MMSLRYVSSDLCSSPFTTHFFLTGELSLDGPLSADCGLADSGGLEE